MPLPRLIFATTLLVATGLDAASGSEQELLRYSLTQGGLLVVVLVLLYWTRTDNKRKHDENQEKLVVLTNLVERAATNSEANASAINRLALAVENLLSRSRN